MTIINHMRHICRAYWTYLVCIISTIVIMATLTAVATAVITTSLYDSKFKVVYSLDSRNTDREIIRLIDGADRYIYFAIYYFTKADIAEALIRAKRRGVLIWGITDNVASLDSNKNTIAALRDAGIVVETQKHQDGIMHMKAIVTDKAYASGSYNWTDSATNANDEILEIGTDKSVHDQYLSIIKKVLTINR